jgi:sugar/nucleoside kinase (ribokinase family)
VYDVVGIGASALDNLSVIDGYPIEDERIEVEGFTWQGGGNVATALVAVARLGGNTCFHGFIGDDENTRTILEGFKREGVDVRHIKIKKGLNPYAFILINKRNSSRTILYSRKDVPIFRGEDVDSRVLRNTKVILIDTYYDEASFRASEIAKERGISVVIDAEWVTPHCQETMNNATHVIASKSFALEYTGKKNSSDIEQVLKEIAGKTTCPFICITLGNKGSIAFDRNNGEVYRQAAFKVDVSDTTGAGDVFHGTFSYLLTKGYAIGELIRYSSACAAMACREIGGRRGIPTMEELLAFIEASNI